MNYHSNRKYPLIGDTIVSSNLDILALAETHIQNSDSLHKTLAPPGFQLTHIPGRLVMVAVWASLLGNLPSKSVDAPAYYTFENIVISTVTHSKSLVVAYIYHTPDLCSSAFLDDFLFSFSFLSSLTSSFIICGDFNVHVDTDCIDQRKFLNLLDTSTLLQM